jgi:hypothetical protein
METPELAPVDLARVFYLQNQHVIAAIGQKAPGSEVEVVESVAADGTVRLRLHQSSPPALPTDTYYLVRPILPKGPVRRSIQLLHAGGGLAVPVEPLSCAAFRVTGHSPSFRFDEAFEDALRQLPMFSTNAPGQGLPLVDLVAMGAIYGGFSGFSRLFVRLGASGGQQPL